MGDVLEPTIPEAGDLCDVCWGIGQFFGNTDTPKYVRADFSGITACGGFEPAGNGSYIITQDPLNHCLWTWGNPAIRAIGLQIWAAGNTSIGMYKVIAGFGYSWFHGSHPGICQFEYANDHELCCPGPPLYTIGTGGQCKVWLQNIEDAPHITFNQGLTQISGLKKEDMPCAGTEKVIFIAGWFDNTKCLVKYEPAET